MHETRITMVMMVMIVVVIAVVVATCGWTEAGRSSLCVDLAVWGSVWVGTDRQTDSVFVFCKKAREGMRECPRM